jgi:ADP-ribosylglycohydrolase
MAFEEKLTGAVFGVAIGDGMGGPVEGWDSARLLEECSGWDFTQFLPGRERGIQDCEPESPWDHLQKGWGRITDDTLMTEALIRAYRQKRDHLDAFDFRDYLLPEMTETVTWVPELQRDTPIIDRLNVIERYTQIRLHDMGAEPRTAGIGNSLNCAIAMYIMPVGAVNAGDPRAAYQEAVALGMAESHSYAVEGAAVLAAGYAAALGAGATVADAEAAALRTARDGTKAAVSAALHATDPADELADWIARVREAVLPYDAASRASALEADPATVIGSYHDPRLAIEEVPVALAALKYGQCDFLSTLKAAVYYGRDCDSIASMACGLCGALTGADGVPQKLRDASCAANRRDWERIAGDFGAAIADIWGADQQRFRRRCHAMECQAAG